MGLTVSTATDCLALVLPNGANRWIGLLTVLPTTEVEATEVSADGYARVAHSSWASTAAADAVSRHNVGTIELPELGGAATTRGWAVYASPEGGDLLAWGELLDGGGEAVAVRQLGAGDRPRFIEGQLVLRFAL